MVNDSEEGQTGKNHLLDQVHTHLGIGIFAVINRLRYVEVDVHGKFLRGTKLSDTHLGGTN